MAGGGRGNGAGRVRVGERHKQNDAKTAKGVAAEQRALRPRGARAVSPPRGVAAVCRRAALWARSGTVARPKRVSGVSLAACVVRVAKPRVAAPRVVGLAVSAALAVLPPPFYKRTLRVAKVAPSVGLWAVVVVPVGAAVEGAAVREPARVSRARPLVASRPLVVRVVKAATPPAHPEIVAVPEPLTVGVALTRFAA